MALTADQKEQIMQARETERVATSKTRLYQATVDGKRVQMLSISGLGPEGAREYCAGIFGSRMTGFEGKA